MIDTGFSGFLSMPIIQAFPLGLVLTGTTGLTLADGSTIFRLTAWGMAGIEGEERGGLIILEQNSTEVLLGMDCLRKFGKGLHVNPVTDSVTLGEDIPLLLPSTAKLPPSDPNKAAPAVADDPVAALGEAGEDKTPPT